jgi:acylphosphatase
VIARHVFVSGLVQGVSFRWSTVQEARRLGVSGWVRNLADGRVEAHVQGPEDAVEALLGWMRRGPRGARVESVEASEVEADAQVRGFAQR